MTKKRRNLRILASIIAAGCVWATGMGNAWADPIGAVATSIDKWNYIAIGDADWITTDGDGQTNPFAGLAGVTVSEIKTNDAIDEGKNGRYYIEVTPSGGDKVVY